ncbi:MAG: DUF3592 domain-containing protein [Pseudomonadota bacterium]
MVGLVLFRIFEILLFAGVGIMVLGASIGALFCLFGARDLWREELRARRFLPLTATIAGGKILADTDSDGTTYFPELLIAWRVKGRSYETDTSHIRHIRQGYPSRRGAEKALERMKRRELVDIVYNHDNPAEIRLANRYRHTARLIAGVGAVCGGAALWMAVQPFL